METFYQVFGVVAALTIGIMVLTLFFTGFNYVRGATRGYDVVKMKGFIRDGKLINVHLSGGKSLTGVRFIGFSENSAKGNIPYQLTGMVVFETAKGARILVRADSVKMIEEIEEGEGRMQKEE